MDRAERVTERARPPRQKSTKDNKVTKSTSSNTTQPVGGRKQSRPKVMAPQYRLNEFSEQHLIYDLLDKVSDDPPRVIQDLLCRYKESEEAFRKAVPMRGGELHVSRSLFVFI